MPIGRSVIGVPMTDPLICSFEKFAVFRSVFTAFADGSFPTGAAKVIDNLVFQNADQPGPFRTTPFKFVVGLEGREKSLLHGVFRRSIVTQSKDRVLEEIVA